MIKQVWVAQNPYDENDITVSFIEEYDTFFDDPDTDRYDYVKFKPAMLIMEDEE